MTPGARPATWGWSDSVRALLAALAALSAGALWLASGSRPQHPTHPAPQLVVDPNTAPAEVLSALPRLGPTLANRIVEARRAAPFATLDDLDARVRGIGPVTMEALGPHLRIEPATTALTH
jgi:competence protein ComEA